MNYWYGDKIINLNDDEIFVFGSNPEGRHGAGAAKTALKFGAKYGIGRGLQGQTYALITKNLKENFIEKGTNIKYTKEGFRSVSKEQIEDNIKELYHCANENTDKKFLITYQYNLYANGIPKKSLNGYDSLEIMEMFICADIPKNIYFHETYKIIFQ